jgi:hypothetical protein
MEKDHITELKEYVDDILLWVHVKEKISISEYKQKIDELNKVCNEIVEKYSETEIFDDATTNNIKTKRIELEQLCYTLMSCIMSNILALHEDDIQKLKSITSTYLDWLIDIDINIKKAETENSSYDIDENIYQEKIDILNGLCNNLYNNLLNVNIEKDINILNCNECNSEDILKILDKFNTSENYGTSISDLKK